MNDAIIKKLHDTAEDFGNIARKVNESSQKRKAHSEKAMQYVKKSLELGEKLARDLAIVAESNIKLRDQNNFVRNTCVNMKSNLEKQAEIMKILEAKKALAPEIKSSIDKLTSDFSSALNDALDNINGIIKVDNDIILLDKIINARKELQQDSLKKLEKLSAISLEDAEKAIKGSASNLERGLSMTGEFTRVADIVQKKDKNSLSDLAAKAAKGREIAAEVNKSSRSQYEFTEKVNQFTMELHDDTTAIMELVDKKHQVFEQNLQTVTVITVTISMMFKNYLAMEEIVENTEYNDSVRSHFNSLKVLVKILCQDIRTISTLNFDMTDSIHLNNEIETRALAVSKDELDYYKKITEKVGAMTETTKYPIEGSAKNMENARILEDGIKQLIAGM
ncbi:MAG TPA: hypothetical protein P5346_10250 [Spirochaetota bacterium]|nr:hypothetical protein [Spirochaetota bacterium]HSA15109.1 hypothetical protein [Spirochaetota bacterium]